MSLSKLADPVPTNSVEMKDAATRQKEKAKRKREKANQDRQTAARVFASQQERVQVLRSKIFAAARSGDADTVKKGVWEQDVDPSGGEIKPGCEHLVEQKPSDPRETLLHIAARHGDKVLLEWLGSHSSFFFFPVVRPFWFSGTYNHRWRYGRADFRRSYCISHRIETWPYAGPQIFPRNLPHERRGYEGDLFRPWDFLTS